MFQQTSTVHDNRMKIWLHEKRISYRSLAMTLGQSAASVSKKVNGEVAWQQKDLVALHSRFGLSSDFVLGLIPFPDGGESLGEISKNDALFQMV
jgi:cyanate lyase